MVSAVTEPSKQVERTRRPQRIGSVAWIRYHADETVLRDGARGPAILAVVGKPVMCELVMHVIGVEECHEDIDIEKRDARHSPDPTVTRRL